MYVLVYSLILYTYMVCFYCQAMGLLGFPGSSAGEESTCNAGDPGLIPGSGS